MRTWFEIRNAAAPTVAEVRVFGPIGQSWADDDAISARSFLEALDKLPASTRTIRVLVNSPGGDIFDALAIANALRGQRTERARVVDVSIEGLAASAATIITSAGSSVAIADNALGMVHNPRGFAMGEAAEMRKMGEALERVRGAIIASYRWVSHLSAEALGRLMDATTWFDADEFVKAGLAHKVVKGVNATACVSCPQARALLGPVPARRQAALAAVMGTSASAAAARTAAGWARAVDQVNREGRR